MTSWVLDGSAPSIEKLALTDVPGAHRSLEAILAAADAESDQPCGLEGWTLGHLVAHLRLNAESHVRVLEAARSNTLVDQYEGGSAGRAAAIEHDSTRPLATLVSELSDAHHALESVWSTMTLSDWHRPTRMRAGERPAHVSLWARWRETCIHSVDLDLGFESDAWSDDFTTAGLDIVVDGQELRSLDARLQHGTVVELIDGSRSWVSRSGETPTHIARGAAQALLGWLVGRPAATPIVWTAEPDLDPWP